MTTPIMPYQLFEKYCSQEDIDRAIKIVNEYIIENKSKGYTVLDNECVYRTVSIYENKICDKISTDRKYAENLLASAMDAFSCFGWNVVKRYSYVFDDTGKVENTHWYYYMTGAYYRE